MPLLFDDMVTRLDRTAAADARRPTQALLGPLPCRPGQDIFEVNIFMLAQLIVGKAPACFP